MELRSIQYFVQIADEGSITRAADKLGVAQPALTRHLKRLETELGTQLLMRLPRGVRLTTSETPTCTASWCWHGRSRRRARRRSTKSSVSCAQR